MWPVLYLQTPTPFVWCVVARLRDKRDNEHRQHIHWNLDPKDSRAKTLWLRFHKILKIFVCHFPSIPSVYLAKSVKPVGLFGQNFVFDVLLIRFKVVKEKLWVWVVFNSCVDATVWFECELIQDGYGRLAWVLRFSSVRICAATYSCGIEAWVISSTCWVSLLAVIFAGFKLDIELC